MPTILPADKKKIHPQENIPSPVSVLDATFYHEGSSPSLKRISDSFKGEDLVWQAILLQTFYY